MALETTALGRTLILDGLAQNDIDMANHRLLNLDTSNLPPMGIPPTINPPANQWLHNWNAALQEWTTTQPRFEDIAFNLTSPQMQHISQVGKVKIGNWEATPLLPPFVPTLDLIRAPVGNVSLSGRRLINVGMPVDPNDAVNLAYMDFLLQGLQPKEAVRCATTNRHALSGLLSPVDGVTLVAGDRVLAKNQGVGGGSNYLNGIYIASTGAWQRAEDCDTAIELERAYVAVLEGENNNGTSWVQITGDLTDPISPEDDIFFVLFSSTPSTNVIAGNGLERIGNTLNVVGAAGRISVNGTVDIDDAYLGQASITKLGVISTGAWHGDVIRSSFGGTGVNNSDHTITLNDTSFRVQRVGLPIPDSYLILQIPGGETISIMTPGIMASLDGVQTLTNKSITKRVQKIVSSDKPIINTDQVDTFYITSLNQAIASMTANLLGDPVDGQELEIWMRDNGTIVVKTITWGNKWTASVDLPLPGTLTTSVWLFMRFKYNDEFLKWVMTEKLNKISP